MNHRFEYAGYVADRADRPSRTASLRCPPARLRVEAQLRAPALDARLAAGANPADSRLLAARAAALTTAHARLALAQRLDQLLAAAQTPLPRRRLCVTPPRAALLQNAGRLAEIAELLRGHSPLYAAGLAQLRRLLSDGAGPLYGRGQGDALAAALAGVRSALAGA